MTREELDLIEEATSAWRPRDPSGNIRAHPAWHDLDEAGRRAVYEETRSARAAEAALDPDGLSSTAHAVLDRIRRSRS
jgi:hypothetical protein